MNSPTQSLLPPRWVILIGLLLGACWIFSELRELILLLVVGYYLAYLIEPLLEWFEKHGIRRSIGVILLLFSLILIVSVLAITAVPTIVKQYDALSANLPEYLETAKTKLGPYWEQLRGRFPEHLRVSSPESLDSTIQSLPPINGQVLQRIFSGLGEALLRGYSLTLTLLNFILLPMIVFYLAVDFSTIHRTFLEMVPLVHRTQALQIAREIDGYVSAYARGQIIVCSILFSLYALGLGIVGIDLWFLIAVIAGFGSMIPYVGFVVGAILGSIMALVTFGDFAHLLQVWLVFAVVQLLEGTVITPKIVGDRVGLSPLVIILAILAGGSLLGILGVFLAVPGAAVIRVLFRHFYRWLVQVG